MSLLPEVENGQLKVQQERSLDSFVRLYFPEHFPEYDRLKKIGFSENGAIENVMKQNGVKVGFRVTAPRKARLNGSRPSIFIVDEV